MMKFAIVGLSVVSAIFCQVLPGLAADCDGNEYRGTGRISARIIPSNPGVPILEPNTVVTVTGASCVVGANGQRYTVYSVIHGNHGYTVNPSEISL